MGNQPVLLHAMKNILYIFLILSLPLMAQDLTTASKSTNLVFSAKKDYDNATKEISKNAKYPIYSTNSAGRVGVTSLWAWPSISTNGNYEIPEPPVSYMKGVSNYVEKVITNKTAVSVEVVK